jgi:hypothetical protein
MHYDKCATTLARFVIQVVSIGKRGICNTFVAHYNIVL